MYWKLNGFVIPLRMPVFFLVSGMLAASQLRRSWKDLLTGRVLTLGYVLVLWSVAQIIAGPVLTGVTWSHAWNELARFMVLPRSVLWFLWALIIYLVIARLARPWRMALIATSAALSLIAFGLDEDAAPFSYLGTLRFAPFFFIGIFFSAEIRAWAEKPQPLVVGALGTLFVLLFLLTYKEIVPSQAFGAVRFTRAIVGASFAVTASVLLCRWSWLRAVPMWIGRRTLEVYVAHSLALSLMVTIIGADSLGAYQVIWVPAFTLAAVAASLALKVAAERVGAYWMYAPPSRLRQWTKRRATPA